MWQLSAGAPSDSARKVAGGRADKGKRVVGGDRQIRGGFLGRADTVRAGTLGACYEKEGVAGVSRDGCRDVGARITMYSRLPRCGREDSAAADADVALGADLGSDTEQAGGSA